MTQPTHARTSPEPEGPLRGQRPQQILDATLVQLEAMCSRAGSGDIADRLRTVCDRLRSAQAALGPADARAPDADEARPS